jgi:hypothetical protein
MDKLYVIEIWAFYSTFGSPKPKFQFKCRMELTNEILIRQKL